MPTEAEKFKSSIDNFSQAAPEEEVTGALRQSAVSVHDGISDSGGLYLQKSLPHFLEDEWFSRSRMPRTPDWSIVWSDLMMTMFIFFVVLYVYSVAQKEFLGPEGLGDFSDLSPPDTRVMETVGRSGGEATWPTEGFIERMFNLSKQALSEEVMEEFASIELVPQKTVRIILTGDLLFDSAQAKVKEEAKKTLIKIARLLQQTPYAIDVIGHTDDLPISTGQFPSNWELSAARASAVARFLINDMKVPGSQFFVTGLGSYQPVKPNDNQANRAANRRVEIVITREKPRASPVPEENKTQAGGANKL